MGMEPLAMVYGFMGIFFMLSLVGTFAFYGLAVYFLAPHPNRIVSAVMQYKINGGAIILLMVAVGGLLNQALSAMGLQSGTGYTWDLPMLRYNIVFLILGLGLWLTGKYFFQKNVFNPTVVEEKNAVTFTSHLVHSIFTTAVIVLKMVLAYILFDYLLSFLLPTPVGNGTFKDFLVDLLTLITPILFLGFTFKKAIMGNKRFLPGSASPVLGIFVLLALTGFFFLTAIGLSQLTHDLSLRALSSAEGNSLFAVVPSLDAIRASLIVLLLGTAGSITTWKKSSMVWKSVTNLKSK